MNNVQCRAEKVERAVRFTVDFKWASGIDFKSNFRLEMKHVHAKIEGDLSKANNTYSYKK